ncbi:LysR family transcriptional regulator [Arthrobacter sp. RT-1]|uniref:LysR family transcriptional regulator n=1 Tax=Arthrobacter sp. RT-1 TaxID=2292263 RepID=UPI0015F125E6|nr:LysR family transcriptional regulator [Arthrobacter sp. RT-1]
MDLNLLLPLRVLLEERNVSAAAIRLNVSQPTASTFLAKLRRYFDDPLLVREGNIYTLSPLAMRLKEELPTALRSVEQIMGAQSEFTPSTSDHEFTILATDYASWRVGTQLLPWLDSLAPGIRIRFDHVLPSHVDGAPDSLKDVDGMLLPHGYLAQQPHVDVLLDEWTCLIASDNPHLGERPSPEELLAMPWIMTISGRGAFTPAARQLQIAGVDPVVSTITPNFFVIPSLIEGSNRAALMPMALAQRAVQTTNRLRIVDPPIPLTALSEAFWWHRDREHEPAHRWFRQQLELACAPLLKPPPQE